MNYGSSSLALSLSFIIQRMICCYSDPLFWCCFSFIGITEGDLCRSYLDLPERCQLQSRYVVNWQNLKMPLIPLFYVVGSFLHVSYFLLHSRRYRQNGYKLRWKEWNQVNRDQSGRTALGLWGQDRECQVHVVMKRNLWMDHVLRLKIDNQACMSPKNPQ